MADSIRDLFFGSPARELVEAVDPQRSFDDVVLPERTLRALDHALALVRKHDLIFRQWGLAERHSTGLGLAFHFAGPPGTGKTICAEALAYTLNRKLLVVRYSELESRWVGQTAKHVAAVFRAAERQDAVLFFDEADAIAGRRFTAMQAAVDREANSVVNVLLHELEQYPGVVIFATNLAANMDPAFERRIRTHILFEMPDVDARERIWRVQIHPRKTPLAEDVDFRALAEAYPRSGGDIKNAVLKAAQMATLEPGPDSGKRIHQHHFIQGMEEVIASTSVMGQSLFENGASPPEGDTIGDMTDAQETLRGELALLGERLDTLERRQGNALAKLDERQGEALEGVRQSVAASADLLRSRLRTALIVGIGAAVLAAAGLVVALLRG
jgi:ATP-dependent 26S proteasome regulatory subunit